MNSSCTLPYSANTIRPAFQLGVRRFPVFRLITGYGIPTWDSKATRSRARNRLAAEHVGLLANHRAAGLIATQALKLLVAEVQPGAGAVERDRPVRVRPPDEEEEEG